MRISENLASFLGKSQALRKSELWSGILGEIPGEPRKSKKTRRKKLARTCMTEPPLRHIPVSKPWSLNLWRYLKPAMRAFTEVCVTIVFAWKPFSSKENSYTLVEGIVMHIFRRTLWRRQVSRALKQCSEAEKLWINDESRMRGRRK